jgi:outer membrane protein assembly factor BamB
MMWCRSKKAAAVILLVIVFALVSSLTWLNEPTDPSALASDSSDSPSILWKYNLASTKGAMPILSDGIIYVCSDLTSDLYAINATTGSLIWRFETTGRAWHPHPLGDTVYLLNCDEPYLRAVDAKSGLLKWTYENSRPYGTDPSMTLANGVLYAENTPYIGALDPDSGAMIWRYAVPYLGPLDSTSVYGFGGYSGQPSYIRALDLTTGALKWSHQENAQMGMPILYEDLLLYYCQDGYISALRKSDGTEKWRCAGKQFGELMIANDTLYCKRDKAVVAIDPLTGTTRWSQDVGDSVRMAEISNGTLYVTGWLGFYALDAATGRLEWSAEQCSLGAIVGDIALVYLCSQTTEAVLALDRHAGTEQWRLGMQPSSPNSLPPLWGGEGYNQLVHVCPSGPIVYLSSPTNPLYAVQIDTGVVDWTFEAGGGIPYAPVVGDGVLYVAGYDGYLYALDITSAGLAIPQPSDLLQLKANGLTAIDVGEATGESTVVFKATVADPDGDRVKLQVELRRLDEYGGQFDETKGGLKESDLISSGGTASITVNDLVTGDYHWRARAVDERGATSVWVSAGDNSDSAIDFHIGFSFIVITDLHIGRGFDDFGTATYDDAMVSGQENCLTSRLADTVDWINRTYKNDNTKFVVVLGDISDSAEKSEFLKAREILDSLEIPYIPLVGNHDIFSCVGDQSTWLSTGDKYFQEVFWGTDARNSGRLAGLFGASWEKQPTPYHSWNEDRDFYFENYAFAYGGINFLCLDYARRDTKSIASVAEPFSQTNDWLENHLTQYTGRPVVVFSHYPYIGTGSSLPLIPGVGGIYLTEIKWFTGLVSKYDKGNVLTFGGHVHAAHNSLNYNVNQTFDTDSIPVIVTKALMESPKDFLRTVSVEGTKVEDIHYDSIESPTSGDVDSNIPTAPCLELLDRISATVHSPAELRVYDSQGRCTGLVNGEVRNEIPKSMYSEGSVLILDAIDLYRYELVGTGEGPYGLTVARGLDQQVSTFVASNIPTSLGAIHQYTIGWDAVNQGEKGVTLDIDSNGDGTVDKSLAAGNELTHDEFMSATSKGGFPFWIWIIVGVGAAAVVAGGILLWRRMAKKPVAAG